MDRIPLYMDVDNLAEIFSMERNTAEFTGIKQLISKESKITLCETEEIATANPLFQVVAQELTSGDFIYDYRTPDESFLDPPFKTNLHEHFDNKRTIFFSYDCERICIAKEKSGLLLAGAGEEIEAYNKLNFKKEFFRANKILTIGSNFNRYDDFEPFILPFSELIINEPYLFKPDRNDWDSQNYIDNNFKPLMSSLLSKVKNKVNIIICTFVNDHDKARFPYYDQSIENETGLGFTPLYELCKNTLKELLGGDRFKLWLVVSPMARKARHDRYLISNYQFIESGAGLTYFDDRENFVNRGEAIHLYSIMHDEARQDLIPSVLNNLQTKVIDKVNETDPKRIYGKENGNSHFLNFN